MMTSSPLHESNCDKDADGMDDLARLFANVSNCVMRLRVDNDVCIQMEIAESIGGIENNGRTLRSHY